MVMDAGASKMEHTYLLGYSRGAAVALHTLALTKKDGKVGP